MSRQQDSEIVVGRAQSGELTADEANIEIVRIQGVKIVYKLPRPVRKALDGAVKRGYLGHIAKDGLMPEVYFHPNSYADAVQARNRRAIRSVESIKKVAG